MANNIYFLCSDNSCRSQMAEGFAKKYLPHWNIQSAGIRAKDIDARTIAVMSEDHIDISQQKSKKINETALKKATLVVTLSGEARDKTTMPANIRWLHWSINDPSLANGTESEIMDSYRDVRDDIKQNILELASQIQE